MNTVVLIWNTDLSAELCRIVSHLCRSHDAQFCQKKRRSESDRLQVFWERKDRLSTLAQGKKRLTSERRKPALLRDDNTRDCRVVRFEADTTQAGTALSSVVEEFVAVRFIRTRLAALPQMKASSDGPVGRFHDRLTTSLVQAIKRVQFRDQLTNCRKNTKACRDVSSDAFSNAAAR